MNSLAFILADIEANWYLYLAMPVVAAAIGYVTKIVAIRMMFHPIEFVGKPPLLGWQGIVPRKAAIMAGIACDTMTQKLIRPRDIFDRLDTQRIAAEIEQPLLAAVDDIARDVLAHFEPGLWESLPERVKRLLIQRIQQQAPAIIGPIMGDIKQNLDTVFDLNDMVVSNLLRDKEMLNRIFLEAGSGEFRFIRNSGAFFGFGIGCVQALGWAATHSFLIMPLFGLFTGWFTDWIALKMVFRPLYPKRYFFGMFRWQGLFLKRREEVARDYGRLIAQEIVTPANILEAVLKGPLSDRIFAMVNREVQKVIDDQSGLARPLVVRAVGGRRYMEMKASVSEKIMERLPDALKHAEGYAREAMDLENLLSEKMAELSPEEFESLLRPAFRQDEWILITVGAALGFLVGELQVIGMEILANPLPGFEHDGAATQHGAEAVLMALRPFLG